MEEDPRKQNTGGQKSVDSIKRPVDPYRNKLPDSKKKPEKTSHQQSRFAAQPAQPGSQNVIPGLATPKPSASSVPKPSSGMSPAMNSAGEKGQDKNIGKAPNNLPIGKPEDTPKFKKEFVKTTAQSAQKKLVAEPPEIKPDPAEDAGQVTEQKSGLESAVGNLLRKEEAKEATKKIRPELKSSLRTYESDIAKAIRDKKASVVSIRAAEQRKRRQEPAEKTKSGQATKRELFKNWNWKKIFIFLLIVLLVLAGLTAIFLGKVEKTKEERQFEEDVVSLEEFFLIEEQFEIAIDNLGSQALRTSIVNELGATVAALGQIEHVYFTEKTALGKRLISFTDFMEAIDATIPAELARNIDDKFMLGVHSFDGNQPFLVIKTDSYGNAFSGMLAWEQDIERDLKEIFIKPNQKTIEEATTTGAVLNLRRKFTDRVIVNRDTRLIEENGETLLLYSFVSTDTIVITTNENTLKEIIRRLERIRFQR